MNPHDLALAATGYMQKMASDFLSVCEERDALLSQKAELEAKLESVIAAFSRPVAIPPVAEVPVREVTGIAVEEEAE